MGRSRAAGDLRESNGTTGRIAQARRQCPAAATPVRAQAARHGSRVYPVRMPRSILVLYMSRGGHTARIARALCAGIAEAGARGERMDLVEATREGVDWAAHAAVVVGAPVLYGTYDRSVFEFVARHRAQLEGRPNVFFNVSLVARLPAKATVEGNRYMQKFLQLSPWRPQELKVFAGKVDYPSWPWHERLMIQLIMKFTQGPTDPRSVIDYTDWEDVAAYGRRLAALA